jgi:flagellar biosynthesis GTPase FlhF
MSKSKGSKVPRSRQDSEFSKPPGGGGGQSASSHEPPSSGVFAGGGQGLPLPPFVVHIVSSIMKQFKGTGMPYHVVVQFATEYASSMPEKMREFDREVDVPAAVAKFEVEIFRPFQIFRVLRDWRTSAGFIPDPVLERFVHKFVLEHPPANNKRFDEHEVASALAEFQALQEQRRQRQQQRQQQEQQQQQQEQQQQQQEQQQQQQEQQQRQQEQQQRQQEQQQPQKPPKQKKLPPPQHGSLQLVRAPKMKKHAQKCDLPVAMLGETAYALVTKAMGDSRFIAESLDTGAAIMCKLAGSMLKGRDNRIKHGDTVLIEIRTDESITAFHQPLATILLKYTPKEIKTLQKMGELTERCSSQKDSSVVFVANGEAAVEQLSKQYDWDLPSESEDDE